MEWREVERLRITTRKPDQLFNLGNNSLLSLAANTSALDRLLGAPRSGTLTGVAIPLSRNQTRQRLIVDQRLESTHPGKAVTGYSFQNSRRRESA